jgi:hypothetical protein
MIARPSDPLWLDVEAALHEIEHIGDGIHSSVQRSTDFGQ